MFCFEVWRWSSGQQACCVSLTSAGPCWASSTRLSSQHTQPGSPRTPTTTAGLLRAQAVQGSHPPTAGLLRAQGFHSCHTGSAGVLGPGGTRFQGFHSSAGRLKKRQKAEPPPRELDLLRYDMKDLGKTPRPALYLGLASLIPFLGPTLFMAVTETYLPELAYVQLAYGASVLSFLGGARWGFALPVGSPAKPDWMNLANSVVPSLLAWVAMLLSDSIIPAVTMVIMGLGVSLHYDLSLLPTYPSWFKALRAVLTTVAFLSLVGTLVLEGFYPHKKILAD